MILYKGAMVDIACVMQRSEKSEKMRVQLEAKLKELQDDMGKIFAFKFRSVCNKGFSYITWIHQVNMKIT